MISFTQLTIVIYIYSAYDTIPYSCGYKIDEVIKNMANDCAALLTWFKDNFLPLNVEKCHSLSTGYLF